MKLKVSDNLRVKAYKERDVFWGKIQNAVKKEADHAAKEANMAPLKEDRDVGKGVQTMHHYIMPAARAIQAIGEISIGSIGSVAAKRQIEDITRKHQNAIEGELTKMTDARLDAKIFNDSGGIEIGTDLSGVITKAEKGSPFSSEYGNGGYKNQTINNLKKGPEIQPFYEKDVNVNGDVFFRKENTITTIDFSDSILGTDNVFRTGSVAYNKATNQMENTILNSNGLNVKPIQIKEITLKGMEETPLSMYSQKVEHTFIPFSDIQKKTISDNSEVCELFKTDNFSAQTEIQELFKDYNSTHGDKWSLCQDVNSGETIGLVHTQYIGKRLFNKGGEISSNKAILEKYINNTQDGVIGGHISNKIASRLLNSYAKDKGLNTIASPLKAGSPFAYLIKKHMEKTYRQNASKTQQQIFNLYKAYQRRGKYNNLSRLGIRKLKNVFKLQFHTIVRKSLGDSESMQAYYKYFDPWVRYGTKTGMRLGSSLKKPVLKWSKDLIYYSGRAATIAGKMIGQKLAATSVYNSFVIITNEMRQVLIRMALKAYIRTGKVAAAIFSKIIGVATPIIHVAMKTPLGMGATYAAKKVIDNTITQFTVRQIKKAASKTGRALLKAQIQLLTRQITNRIGRTIVAKIIKKTVNNVVTRFLARWFIKIIESLASAFSGVIGFIKVTYAAITAFAIKLFILFLFLEFVTDVTNGIGNFVGLSSIATPETASVTYDSQPQVLDWTSMLHQIHNDYVKDVNKRAKALKKSLKKGCYHEPLYTNQSTENYRELISAVSVIGQSRAEAYGDDFCEKNLKKLYTNSHKAWPETWYEEESTKGKDGKWHTYKVKHGRMVINILRGEDVITGKAVEQEYEEDIVGEGEEDIGTTFDTSSSAWTDVCRKFKMQFAREVKNHKLTTPWVGKSECWYYSQAASITFTTDFSYTNSRGEIIGPGVTVTARRDCSGFVSVAYNLFTLSKANAGTGKVVTSTKGSSGFQNALPGFEKLPWPKTLKAGDILVYKGHVEVFAGMEDGSKKVYNAGSDKSITTLGATAMSHSSGICVQRMRKNVTNKTSDQAQFTANVSGAKDTIANVDSYIAPVTTVFNRTRTTQDSYDQYLPTGMVKYHPGTMPTYTPDHMLRSGRQKKIRSKISGYENGVAYIKVGGKKRYLAALAGGPLGDRNCPTAMVGQCYDVILETGETIPFVVSDAKSYAHTDDTGYATLYKSGRRDGAIHGPCPVEFLSAKGGYSFSGFCATRGVSSVKWRVAAFKVYNKNILDRGCYTGHGAQAGTITIVSGKPYEEEEEVNYDIYGNQKEGYDALAKDLKIYKSKSDNGSYRIEKYNGKRAPYLLKDTVNKRGTTYEFMRYVYSLHGVTLPWAKDGIMGDGTKQRYKLNDKKKKVKKDGKYVLNWRIGDLLLYTIDDDKNNEGAKNKILFSYVGKDTNGDRTFIGWTAKKVKLKGNVTKEGLRVIQVKYSQLYKRNIDYTGRVKGLRKTPYYFHCPEAGFGGFSNTYRKEFKARYDSSYTFMADKKITVTENPKTVDLKGTELDGKDIHYGPKYKEEPSKNKGKTICLWYAIPIEKVKFDASNYPIVPNPPHTYQYKGYFEDDFQRDVDHSIIDTESTAAYRARWLRNQKMINAAIFIGKKYKVLPSLMLALAGERSDYGLKEPANGKKGHLNVLMLKPWKGCETYTWFHGTITDADGKTYLMFNSYQDCFEAFIQYLKYKKPGSFTNLQTAATKDYSPKDNYWIEAKFYLNTYEERSGKSIGNFITIIESAKLYQYDKGIAANASGDYNQKTEEDLARKEKEQQQKQQAEEERISTLTESALTSEVKKIFVHPTWGDTWSPGTAGGEALCDSTQVTYEVKFTQTVNGYNGAVTLSYTIGMNSYQAKALLKLTSVNGPYKYAMNKNFIKWCSLLKDPKVMKSGNVSNLPTYKQLYKEHPELKDIKVPSGYAIEP
ncbi:hypothetical protein SAMN05216391_10966 [Lachnospiraceae bacterium KHCPX20]|nr:hypothetical protein SAMN05216391_10966 [Lachnospiraceae bacterium KHCPX20]